MKTTPRWLITVLRESTLDQPVLPWQRGYRTGDRPASPAAAQIRADAVQLQKIA
jgi:hypothetical protein